MQEQELIYDWNTEGDYGNSQAADPFFAVVLSYV